MAYAFLVLSQPEQYTSLELHGFSDASEIGYGACIYLRSTSINGAYRTHLFCSKSRVVPLKSVASAPRVMWCIATGSSQQDLQMSHLSNSIHSSMDGFYNCTIMVAIVQSILVNLRGKSHW
ncbi:PREDICTED: uncharacterized protein LOC105149099 [Acromyrmex echinatior]|uniref:uncharacterized protein LOC105149099 n=1 Tax=Acromyrmex echinatior TaxID=103372 RepID=UPI000580ECD5|nr:PREDICTED: uncharacterized protein LOC105149099 [Acromyrmex echinatior]